MWQALLWGVISGSAMILGVIISFLVPINKRVTGCIMAFGTGVLIAATSFDLLLNR